MCAGGGDVCAGCTHCVVSNRVQGLGPLCYYGSLGMYRLLETLLVSRGPTGGANLKFRMSVLDSRII